MGYPNHVSALPTPVVGGPTTSTVHPASTLFSTALATSSLSTLTNITTTTSTAPVTGSAVDSVSSKLATGLEFLALAPRPPGVEAYSAAQLSVLAAAPPTAQPLMATTPATVQQPGNATTATVCSSASVYGSCRRRVHCTSRVNCDVISCTDYI